MGARFWAPYPFRDWAGHQFLFRTSERQGGFLQYLAVSCSAYGKASEEMAGQGARD